MVVMGIIGIMTLTITTSIDSMLPGERLNTTIRVLASDLRSVRAEAISHNMEYRLTYDLEKDQYRWSTPFSIEGGVVRLERDQDYDTGERLYSPWVRLADGVSFARIFIAGEVYEQGQVQVIFDAIGTATDHSVILTQPKYEQFFTLEVLPLSGLIKMHDGEYLRQEPDDGDFQ